MLRGCDMWATGRKTPQFSHPTALPQ